MSGASSRALRRTVVLLALLNLVPVAMLVLRALAPTWRFPEVFPSQLTTAVEAPTLVGDTATAARLRDALLNSLLLALVAGAVATACGFAAGRALSRAAGWVRRAATMAAFLPVIAPPIALGVGVQVLTLTVGVGGTWTGVLVSHLVPATGYATLYFLGVLSAVEHSMEEEARTLGATRWQALWRVTIPVLRGRLADAFVLAALVSWGQLALTLLVGGGAVRTLPVELLSYVRAGDDRVGAMAALLLTVPPLLALGVLQAGVDAHGGNDMTAATGLEVHEAQVRFGRQPGLEGLSLQVARGERVALVGPSGGGKTSLLRAIAGLDALTGGRIVVGGRDVTAAEPEARRVVYLHQAPSLFPHLSVLDNVAFPLEVRGTDRTAARRRAYALLEGVGLAPLAARRGASLSGGQRHRAALARALAAEPEVLLLDEPFAALDPALRAEVRETVVALLDARGPAVVLVTHDIDEASGFAHRLAVLLDRRLVQVAPPADLLRAPATVDVARFLGIPNIVRGVRDGDGRFVSPLGRCQSPGATGAAVLVARPDAIVASPGGEWIIESRHERIGGTVLRVRREELVVTVTPARGDEVRVGDRVRLEVDMARAHVIASDGAPSPTAASPKDDVDPLARDGRRRGGGA